MVYDSELVLSMNEDALRKLYEMYSKTNRGTDKKPHNADYMTYIDCEQLFRDDCPLMLSRFLLREAYSLCKMTVVNELDAQGDLQYQKLLYVEFLEFIARVADLFFKGSEMDDLELHEKIEHILDEILPIVEAKRVKQKIIIEEFSESDEDY